MFSFIRTIRAFNITIASSTWHQNISIWTIVIEQFTIFTFVHLRYLLSNDMNQNRLAELYRYMRVRWAWKVQGRRDCPSLRRVINQDLIILPYKFISSVSEKANTENSKKINESKEVTVKTSEKVITRRDIYKTERRTEKIFLFKNHYVSYANHVPTL